MRPLVAASLLVSGAVALAFPATEARQAKAGCDAPVSLDATKNIFLDYSLHSNVFWRRDVAPAVEAIKDAETKRKATNAKIADKGTFVWIETREDVKKIEEAAQDVPCKNVLGLVLGGLPYKECLSIGMPPSADPWDYQAEFIDPIVKAIKAHPNTAFALVVEPGVMGNYVLNPNMTMCDHVKRSYRQNVPAALKKLDLPNVAMYLDGAHGGVFGWRVGVCKTCIGSSQAQNYVDNPVDAALEFDRTWLAAGKPKQLRGLAINVQSFNSWDMSPGEAFANENALCASDKNKARSEKLYLQLLKAALQKVNSTLPFHALMDSGRNGVQGIRAYWSDWCNVNNAGFGIATTKTGHADLDAFVWVSNGGFSDGTSDANSYFYRAECAARYTRRDGQVFDIAFRPMPDRGVFSQAYFEMLVVNGRGMSAAKRGSRTVRAVQPLPSYECQDGR